MHRIHCNQGDMHSRCTWSGGARVSVIANDPCASSSFSHRHGRHAHPLAEPRAEDPVPRAEDPAWSPYRPLDRIPQPFFVGGVQSCSRAKAADKFSKEGAYTKQNQWNLPAAKRRFHVAETSESGSRTATFFSNTLFSLLPLFPPSLHDPTKKRIYFF